MGKKRQERKASQTKTETSDLIKSLTNMSWEEISALSKGIPYVTDSKIQAAFNSSDPEEIMKASLYIENNKKNQSHQIDLKSVLFDPNDISNSGKSFKGPRGYGALSFDVLRRMGQIFLVRSIVNTRIEQIQNFLHFSLDEQKEGYTIRKKKSLFDDKSSEKLSKEEQKKIEYIVNFLERGGNTGKWDSFDTFQDFSRKILFDSLTLDQLSFEMVRNKGNELEKFSAVDASLIRYLDSVDPKFQEEFEKYRYKGYLPRFCMAWQDQILINPTTKEHVIYYPWELGFGIRNKSTDVFRNNYGTSELETLVEIITWVLYGMSYNGNFFSKGSQPKGFINIKNANIDNTTLNEFRQAWTQTMRGTENSHRVPVINGIDLEWIDLQKGNRDMEFNEWLRFLFVITCSVYRIDPSELGFQFKEQANVLGQEGQKQRLEHSREKGLKPLLIFYQNIVNHFIVSEIDPDFEFVFTGIEIDDEAKQVELDGAKLSNGMTSMEDMFLKYSGREFDPEKDTILNQVYQTAAAAKQNAAMYGGNVDGQEVEGVPEETAENPYEKYEKSVQSNPIMSAAFDYINKSWGEKK